MKTNGFEIYSDHWYAMEEHDIGNCSATSKPLFKSKVLLNCETKADSEVIKLVYMHLSLISGSEKNL